MRRGVLAPTMVVAISVAAGGWLLQEGVDRADNVYVRARVFQEVVDHVSSSFVEEVDQETLYNSAIDGLIDELGDPHSSFLPASDYEDLRIQTGGEYGGVGLEVVDRNGFVTVVAPIPGSPGSRSGIRAGDQFFEIAGVAADTMLTDQAVELLRGRPGTQVSVRMLRPGVDEPLPFTLERAVIELRAVPFATMLEDGVGYVPLQTVRETSSKEIREAVDSLQKEGMRALVLDLRGNLGGLLDEGIAVSDLFLDVDDVIVETRGRSREQNDTYRATQPDRYADIPVVVLVDAASASASEIIAGALQDHDRAAVLGETSFGKGSVQSLYRLTGGNVLRLTTAKWYTPLGRSIHLDPDTPLVENGHALALSGQIIRPGLTEGRPEFESPNGRTLYGGGGITPDLFVAHETLSDAEADAARRMFARGGPFYEALFSFAVAFVSGHPDLQPGFALNDDELESFFLTLSGAELQIERADFNDALRFVRYHLEREIAQQAWGDPGEFHHTLPYDRQLQRTLEVLVGVASTDELLSAVAEADPDVFPGA